MCPICSSASRPVPEACTSASRATGYGTSATRRSPASRAGPSKRSSARERRCASSPGRRPPPTRRRRARSSRSRRGPSTTERSPVVRWNPGRAAIRGADVGRGRCPTRRARVRGGPRPVPRTSAVTRARRRRARRPARSARPNRKSRERRSPGGPRSRRSPQGIRTRSRSDASSLSLSGRAVARVLGCHRGEVQLVIRDEAWAILCEHTKSESLRKHGLAVEAAMRRFAQKYGENEEMWAIAGLLHDFDYERDPEGHPQNGKPLLEQAGVPGTIVHAIQSHGDHTGIPRVTALEKTLYAVDELCGFVTAVALVKPSRAVRDVDAASVRK